MPGSSSRRRSAEGCTEVPGPTPWVTSQVAIKGQRAACASQDTQSHSVAWECKEKDSGTDGTRPARLSAAAPCGVAEPHPAAPCHGQRLLGPLGDRLALGLRHQRHDADGGVVHLRARVFGPSDAAMMGRGCRFTGTVCVSGRHTVKMTVQRTRRGSLGQPYIPKMSRRGGQTCHVSTPCSSRSSS